MKPIITKYHIEARNYGAHVNSPWEVCESTRNIFKLMYLAIKCFLKYEIVYITKFKS